MISSTTRRCLISSRFAPPQYRPQLSTPERMCVLRPSMMFCSTVMPRNSATFWKVRAMPRCATR